MSRNWAAALTGFLPGFLREHPVLGQLVGRADAVLHGSTTFGVDDAVSDLDLWLLLPEAALGEVDAASATRFFEFELDGKPGHLNAESAEAFTAGVDRCDLVRIAELRTAEVVAGGLGAGAELIRRARLPMPEDVRRAFACFHFTEMRGCHKSAKGPMERGDPVAVLLSLTEALRHALQTAMVLDGEPYPYEKWLRRFAAQTATGETVVPHVEAALDVLAAGGLAFAGPLAEHPVNRALYAIREALIDAARERGIDEPWLGRWWLYMTQAHDGIDAARWPR